MLDISEWEWAHNAAYNSMLQASRALMFAKGYRPLSQEHHVAVIAFMNAVYQNKFGESVIQAFDRARKKRNKSIYDRTCHFRKPEQESCFQSRIFCNQDIRNTK